MMGAWNTEKSDRLTVELENTIRSKGPQIPGNFDCLPCT